MLVVPGDARPAPPPRATEYLPPWQPRKGTFVSLENGWGQRIRGEIVAVPKGPVQEFGVRLTALGRGSLHWLSMSTRGVLWREEA